MAFSLQNITATENVISSLSDRPQMNSSALKDKFDQMGEQIKSQVNERIVSAVNGAIATSVTATDEKIPTSNAVKSYVDAQIIEAGAGDMTKANYDSTNTGNKVDKAIVAEGLTSDALASIKLAMYPIGAVYTSVLATDPSTLFGGTWQRIGEGRVLVGVNSQDSDFNASGKTGGEKTHVLTTSELASHTHTFTGSSVTSGTPSENNTGNQSSNHSHSGTTGSKGFSGNAETQVQTAIGTNGGWAFWNTTANHTHSFQTGVNLSSHYHSLSSHTHNVTAKGSNSSTGSGSAHNNMPPYYAVYMWKRVS